MTCMEAYLSGHLQISLPRPFLDSTTENADNGIAKHWDQISYVLIGCLSSLTMTKHITASSHPNLPLAPMNLDISRKTNATNEKAIPIMAAMTTTADLSRTGAPHSAWVKAFVARRYLSTGMLDGSRERTQLLAHSAVWLDTWGDRLNKWLIRALTCSICEWTWWCWNLDL